MPSCLQLGDQLADLRRLGRPEGGGRLVHDQDPGVEVDRPGDRDRLALAAGQRLHRRLEALEVRVQPAHDLACRGLHRRVVEGPVRVDELAAEEEVRRRVDVVGEGERLVDRLDPERLRVARVRDLNRLAVQEDLARVGPVRAGQDPHERRLAGAVAADEADDLAWVQVDDDVLDGVDATERHADVAHLDDRRAARPRERRPARERRRRGLGLAAVLPSCPGLLIARRRT